MSVPIHPRIRPHVGGGLLPLIQVSALLTLLTHAATAQTTRLRVGELEMALDGQSWRFEQEEPTSLRLVPIGKMSEHARPVLVTRTPIDGLGNCEALARAQLAQFRYGEPKVRMIDVGSVQAVQASAHSRCRNLTPVGTAICIPYRGWAYLIVDRIVGCKNAGLALRSTGDWFDDVVGSVRLSP
jgi:hypothetical protein